MLTKFKKVREFVKSSQFDKKGKSKIKTKKIKIKKTRRLQNPYCRKLKISTGGTSWTCCGGIVLWRGVCHVAKMPISGA